MTESNDTPADLAHIRRLAEAARDAEAAWLATSHCLDPNAPLSLDAMDKMRPTAYADAALAEALRWPVALALIARVEAAEANGLVQCLGFAAEANSAEAERDTALARAHAAESEVDVLDQSFADVCDELGCARDNEAALFAAKSLKDRVAVLELALRSIQPFVKLMSHPYAEFCPECGVGQSAEWQAALARLRDAS